MSVGGVNNSSTRSTGASSLNRSSNDAKSDAASTHTVKSGDTLSQIARDHGRSTQELINANPQIENPDLIFPGQEINIPGRAAPTNGANGTAETGQVAGQQDGFERGGGTRPQIAADPSGTGGAANVPTDPALANEVSNLRAGGGYRGGSSSNPQTEEQSSGPGSLHLKPNNGQTGSRNVINGRSASTSRQRNNYGDNYTVRSRTDSSSDGNTTTSTRNGTARNNQTGREHSSTRTTTEQNQRRSARDNVSATGVLGEVNIAGDSDFHGLVTSNDTRHTADETGAGGEYHVLAAQGRVDGAATVDLANGQVNVGINATGRADLVGVSGRAQLGSTQDVAGAGFVEGEANIGARGDVGAGVRFDPANGEVGARVGAEAFAGAEVRGTVGYENRYGGASVTGRAQAGIGGAASAEIGYSDGNFRARADLGAAIGLGGRVTVDINVNVGNIVSDAGSAIAGAWNSIWD